MSNRKLLDRKLTKHAAGLLSQQIWCWGRDIECSSGNLLLEHGFQRFEKPAGSKAASIYRLELAPTSRVILRGFGVFFGDDHLGGLFIRRFEFSPKRTPESDLHSPAWKAEDLPTLTAPRGSKIESSRQLLIGLIDWIHQYEVWIRETKGIEYRQTTLDSWDSNKKVLIPADEVPSAWQSLGLAIADVTVAT